MRRLYWKIFFAFWLVIVLVIATNLAVTWLQVRHFEDADQQSQHISHLAVEAVKVYEEQGLPGLNRWKEQLRRRSDLRVLLLDDDNRLMSGRRLPPHLWALLYGRSRDGHAERGEEHVDDDHPAARRPFRKRDRPIIWPLTGANGERYHFVLLNPHELIDHLYSSTMLLWRVCIAVLVVALVAMLLSHYLVKPIRVLQHASRKLANGDLDSRVARAMGARRDELGQLGQDFDAMAQRIQALLVGQQQLLRDVSHELRTPLARLRIALELARKRSGESKELDRMELEAERINDLIDEILHLVRLNSEAADFQPTSLDLVPMMQSLVADANFEQQRVSLTAPAQMIVKADDKLLHRAVENIVRNALKYSEGEVQVVLESNQAGVRLRILDAGPGVDEGSLPLLFEPFFRADPSRERNTGGYGLGLAIAARAVHRHGGEISARNRPQGGLEVSITLP